jgi:hypothetical protein
MGQAINASPWLGVKIAFFNLPTYTKMKMTGEDSRPSQF